MRKPSDNGGKVKSVGGRFWKRDDKDAWSVPASATFRFDRRSVWRFQWGLAAPRAFDGRLDRGGRVRLGHHVSGQSPRQSGSTGATLIGQFILAKAMSEESLMQVAAIISAKKMSLTPEEARELARRALKFKQERGRLPSLTSPDAWEKRMAEGVAFLARMQAEAANG